MRFKTFRLQLEVLNPHKDQLLIFYILHIDLLLTWNYNIRFALKYIGQLYLIHTYISLTAHRLAQLVEHRTIVREVRGSSPRPDQHSGS